MSCSPFVLFNGQFIDNVDGGLGSDTLDLSNIVSPSGAVDIDLAAGTFDGFGGPTTISSIETIIGTQGDDSIVGAGGSQTINGEGGDDTIEGSFGTDDINGGAGNDTIIINNGEFIDNIDGGLGSDTLNLSSIVNPTEAVDIDLAAGTFDGFGGPTTISSIETIIGTQGDDSIVGAGGSELLIGQGGG